MTFMKSPMIVADTKYGTIRVVSVGNGRVMADIGDATSHAHVNDKTPALTYRGEEYVGSAWFTVDASGTVATSTDSSTDVSIARRANWSAAPRTYANAMVDAMSETIAAVITENPTFLRDGERASVNNNLDRATEERDEIATKLAAAEQTVSELSARLDALS